MWSKHQGGSAAFRTYQNSAANSHGDDHAASIDALLETIDERQTRRETMAEAYDQEGCRLAKALKATQVKSWPLASFRSGGGLAHQVATIRTKPPCRMEVRRSEHATRSRRSPLPGGHNRSVTTRDQLRSPHLNTLSANTSCGMPGRPRLLRRRQAEAVLAAYRPRHDQVFASIRLGSRDGV